MCIYVYICTYVYIQLCIQVCMFIIMYICICVMYIYTFDRYTNQSRLGIRDRPRGHESNQTHSLWFGVKV